MQSAGVARFVGIIQLRIGSRETDLQSAFNRNAG